MKNELIKIKIESNSRIGDDDIEAVISCGVFRYCEAVESSLNPHVVYNSRSATVKNEITRISKKV